MGNVAHAELGSIASSKLAVDGQIEESQIRSFFCNLKPYSDGPDISQS
jgi:hypothetical protein